MSSSHGHDHSHAASAHDASPAHAGEHKHPTTGQYTWIAVTLFAITGVEIYASVAPVLQPPERHTLLVSTLVILGAIKFLIVIGYFMHLRFDARVYTRLFLAPLVVATLVGVVVVIFQQLHHYVTP